ncbi:MAG: hypothetical protein GC200_11170 [Tepidisphaera sp.]|nr:hypothetical protein [Tepidisphaera sp.]
MRSLISYQGQLIAGGAFSATQSGSPLKCIARWDGQSWQPLGAGVTDPSSNATIWCMAAGDDGLYVGGEFNSIGGVPAINIARWDGIAWHALGVGLDGRVDDLLMYQGQMYAAGQFAHSGGISIRGVARWNGTTWEATGDTGGQAATNLAEFQGALYANLGTGEDQSISTLCLLSGNAWQSLLVCPVAHALHAAGNTLYIGGERGSLSMPGQSNQGGYSGGLISWDGVRARCLLACSVQSFSGIVYSIIDFQNGLSIAGLNTKEELPPRNTQTTGMLFSLTNDRWRSFPGRERMDAGVSSVVEYNGKLVVGGAFYQLRDFPANFVAMWDGRSWTPMGEGLPGPVTRLLVHDGELLAAGRRNYYAPGEPGGYVRRFVDGLWMPIGPEPPGAVTAFIESGGDLLIGGPQRSVSGADIGAGIWRWDGSNWPAFGNLTGYVPAGTQLCSYSLALLGEFRGQIVHALFTSELSLVTGRCDPYLIIQKWTGEDWELAAHTPLPATPNNHRSLYCFAEVDNELWMGGSNPSVVRSATLSDWSEFANINGDGNTPPSINAIATDAGGSTIVGGVFGSLWSGGSFNFQVKGVARWDGAQFQPLSLNPLNTYQAIAGSVNALTTFRGEIIAGGNFSSAGGVPALNIARWSDSGLPTFSQQPAPALACLGDAASFSVLPASGYGDDTLTYRWIRNNTPLIDGPQPSGSAISGATTPLLTITGVSAADAADYACTVTDACGSATSQAAPLTLRPAYDRICGGPGCDPDLNHDGVADDSDIAYLINTIAGGDNPTNINPDFNQDGAADQTDIDALINVIAGGVCP